MTDWLEEIEARAEAATPGPWYPKATDDALCMNARYVSLDPGEWAHDNETFMAEPTAYDRVVAITMLQYPRLACLADAKWDENTEFIAHSRTDIPRLIARVRELEAQAGSNDAHGRMLYQQVRRYVCRERREKGGAVTDERLAEIVEHRKRPMDTCIAIVWKEDYDWLIARVRQLQEDVELVQDAAASQCVVLGDRIAALEAQAALDAAEALVRHHPKSESRDGQTFCPFCLGDDWGYPYVEKHEASCVLQGLRAALAARARKGE